MAAKDLLFAAARRGDVAGVKSALHQCQRFLVDSRDSHEQTALHYACYNGHGEVVQVLLDHGATVDVVNKPDKKLTPLMCTVLQSDNYLAARHLLEKGASLDLQDSKGESALMIAIKHGRTKVVELLLNEGANINLQANDGMSALMFAVAFGCLEAVRLLLERGPTINSVDKEDWSALIWGTAPAKVNYDSCEVVQLLLEKGADIDQQTKPGMSALMYTCQANSRWEQGREGCRVVMARNLLLQRGAKVDLRNELGMSALMLACRDALWDVANELLCYGARTDLVDKLGKTALIYFCMNDLSMKGCYYANIFHQLLAGADVDIQDKEGWSALMIAIKNGNDVLSTALLEKSAELNLQNGNGISALMLASGRGHLEVVTLLLDKGADVDLTDNDGWAALAWASGDLGRKSLPETASVSLAVVKLLLERRVNINHQDNEGMSALMNTCTLMERWNGKEPERLEMVKLLLANNANADQQNKRGSSALLLACMGKLLLVVDLLLKHGVRVDLVDEEKQSALIHLCKHPKDERMLSHQNKEGDTALFKVTRKGKFDLAKKLLDRGVDPNSVDFKNKSALIFTAINGHSDISNLLVQRGANMEIQDEDGRTAFLHATINVHYDLADQLVERGADVNIRDNYGQSALAYVTINNIRDRDLATQLVADVNIRDNHGEHNDFATQLVEKGNIRDNKHYSFATRLVEKGVDVNTQDNNGRSPLLHAAIHGDSDWATHLVEKGADVNLKDNDGKFPLLFVAQNGQKDFVKFLVDKGAKLNLQDNAKNTALLVSLDQEDDAIANFLIDKGADVNMENENGVTPVICGTKNGHQLTVERLIKAGAELDRKDNKGMTALSYASSGGQCGIARALLDGGASIDIQDRDGRAPLHHAMDAARLEVVTLLITQGADEHLECNQGKSASKTAQKNPDLSKVLKQAESSRTPCSAQRKCGKFKTWLQFSSELIICSDGQDMNISAHLAVKGIHLEVEPLKDVGKLWKASVCTLPLLLPHGYQAVSPVYRIEQLMDTLDSVTVSLHHYATQSENLVVLSSGLTPSSGSVYDFEEVTWSDFYINESNQMEGKVNRPGHLLVASKSEDDFMFSLRLHVTHYAEDYIEGLFYVSLAHPFYEGWCDNLRAIAGASNFDEEHVYSSRTVVSDSITLALRPDEKSWDVTFDHAVISKESVFRNADHPPRINISARRKTQSPTDPPTIIAGVTDLNQQLQVSFNFELRPHLALSLSILSCLKWLDKERHKRMFRLKEKVSPAWREFGIQLGLDPKVLDGWFRLELGNFYSCWDRVMDRWLKGDIADYPATLEGLDTLLKDVGHSEAAKELKGAVLKWQLGKRKESHLSRRSVRPRKSRDFLGVSKN